MSYNKNKASFASLRSLAFGSIGASYVAVGTALTLPAVMVSIYNGTDKDMTFSTDGSTDMIIVPTGVRVIYDIRANAPSTADYMIPAGTQFSVKQVAAPSSGSVYVEVLQAGVGA